MLRWKQDGYLYFAHGSYGMWTIEQQRGNFEITLTIAGSDQEFGSKKSLALAKKEVERSHKELSKLGW